MTNGDIRDDMLTEWHSPPAYQRLSFMILTNQETRWWVATNDDPGAICNGNICDDRGTMNGTIESHHQLYYVTRMLSQETSERVETHFADDQQCQQCDPVGVKMPGIVLHNRRFGHV